MYSDIDIFKRRSGHCDRRSPGPGRALCDELSERGAAISFVADINPEGAQKVAAAIASKGDRTLREDFWQKAFFQQNMPH